MKNPPIDPRTELDEYYGIKILKNGTWLYNGTPINRHNLVKLFASVLQRDAKGDYWLVTPYEKGRIEVEDAPFTAVELQVESSGKSLKLRFRTNLDEWVEAGPAHPLRVAHDGQTGEPSPYIMVRGAGEGTDKPGIEARIVRPVYYELVKLAVPDGQDKEVFGVWSAGEFYPVGRLKE